MLLGSLVLVVGCSTSHPGSGGDMGEQDASSDAGDVGDAHADSAPDDTDSAVDAGEDATTGEDAALDAGEDGATDAGQSSDASVALKSLSIEPVGPTIAQGTSLQLTAIGLYDDNSTRDLTDKVSWGSSDDTKASLSNSSPGLVSALASGQVTISVGLDAVVGTTVVTVSQATLVSLAVTPVATTIAFGTKQQFSASGTFSDGTNQDLTASATWSSSASNVASIDVSGLATGAAAGQTTITASFGGQMGSTTLDVSAATLVSLALTPSDPTLAKGTQTQFSAVGTFSDSSTQDLTDQVSWGSSDSSVASIEGATGTPGLASALATGTTTISASSGSVVGMTMLTVSNATLVSLSITPANASFPAGTSQRYIATGMYSDGSTQDLTTTVAWTSTASGVAVVSNAAGTQGVVTGVAAGSAMISAATGNVSGSTQATITQATLSSIAVSPTLRTIAKGTTLQFRATGTYSDGSTQDITQSVTWASTSGTVAAISNASGSEGLATGLTGGQTTVSASQGSVSGSTTLTVSTSTLTSITVTPVNPTIAAGTTQAFVATGVYSDNSTQDLTTSVTWASSDTMVATIGNVGASDGVATGVGPGQALISATLGTVIGSTTVTVTPVMLTSISITPADPSIPRQSTQQFTATGSFSDGSTQDITALVNWTSSDTNVATIGSGGGRRGLATSLAAGQTTITARRGNVMGTTTLHVTSATLTSISVTPADSTLARGTTLQFTATATYSDTSTRDITSSANWSSSSTAVALITNFAGSKGLATGVGAGMATIRASLSGVNGSTSLTVTGATLVSIAVTPANQSIMLGHTQQYTATGTYSDSSTQDLTTQVTWFSSRPAVAVISNTPGSKGLASAVTSGDTTIRATLSGVNGTTSATVP